MLIKKYFLSFILLLLFSRLHSQLCNGSLGDPIINITFGSGTNPGPPLTNTTNLQYVPYDCPNDGNYTIRNNTAGCFGNTWYALNSDHTGNANGYFMLINASLQKSQFYIDTIKGLCPNTTYEFAAWLMNIILPSACLGNSLNPNLTFNIEKTDGTILKTYTTGDITALSAPLWKQYGFFFTTPADASDVVVRISNNSTGGCGNDLAIDDITFRPCGAKLSSFIVGTQNNVKELCEGDNATVTLSCDISNEYNNPAFQWQQSADNGNTYTDIADANSSAFVKNITADVPAGNYLYRLIVADGANINLPSCRIASNTLTIRIYSIPVTNATTNSPVCEGAPLILSASGGSEYIWNGPNSFSASGPSVTINNAGFSDAGKFYVTITSAGGCKSIDSANVIIIPGPVAATGFDSKTICQNDSVYLRSSGGTSYQWFPASGLSSSVIADPIAKPADTTTYVITVENEAGCKDSAAVTVNVIGAPKADAGPDKNILEGQSIQLFSGENSNGNNYRWSPDQYITEVYSSEPIVNPINDITYFLTVSSQYGCGIARDSVKIHVFKTVSVPNAFSPNNDGINDTWNIKALNTYNDYELSVFNRYGQSVFTTKNYSNPWNGSFNGNPLPMGTYYYLIDLKQGLPKLKGFVAILR